MTEEESSVRLDGETQTESDLECQECLDEVYACDECEKHFKGTLAKPGVIYCATSVSEEGNEYQIHYCSQHCVALGMSTKAEVW